MVLIGQKPDQISKLIMAIANQKNKPAGKKKKNSVRTLLQLTISVIFVLLIYGSSDLGSLFNTLRRVSWLTGIAVALLYTFGQIVSAYKWRILFQRVGIQRTFSETLHSYFLGMFVNTFGLGTVGGDVVRGIALRPGKGQRAAALGTVVADRVHGLVVLATIGCIAALFVRPEVFGAFVVPLAAIGIVCLPLAWWFGPKIITAIFPKHHRFGQAASQVAQAFPSKFVPVLTVTLISVFFHFVQIMMVVVIATELNAPLSLGYLCLVVPLANIASALPISINGVGVREAIYVLMLVPIGVPHETAIAFGAIWILAITIVSALGGLIVGPATAKLAERDALKTAEEEVLVKPSPEQFPNKKRAAL